MEHYRFFNNTPDDVREYKADDFAEYFRSFLTSGIFNQDNSLEVQTKGLDMNVLVCEGFAFLTGYLYKNDDKKVLALNPADAFLNRIDRIVLRLDHNNRFIKALVKQGEVNENPIPPELTRTETIYELSLAKINIIAGKSFVERDQIIDERMDENICGYVSSLVTIPTNEMWDDWLENKTRINNDWTTWFNEAKNKYSQLDLNLINKEVESLKTNILDNNKYLDDHKKESNPHDITCLKIGAEPKITKKTGFNLDKSDVINSTSKTTLATSYAVKIAYDKGKTALDEANKKEPKITKKTGFNLNKSDAVTSTSKTTLATSYAVKVAYDKANQAFISASNGKKLIANAITGVGIPANSDETFSSLASKINKVNDFVVEGPFTKDLLKTSILNCGGYLPKYRYDSFSIRSITRDSLKSKIPTAAFLTYRTKRENTGYKEYTEFKHSYVDDQKKTKITNISAHRMVLSQGLYMYSIKANYVGNSMDNNIEIKCFNKFDASRIWTQKISFMSPIYANENYKLSDSLSYLENIHISTDPDDDSLYLTFKNARNEIKLIKVTPNRKITILATGAGASNMKTYGLVSGYKFSNGNYVTSTEGNTKWFNSSNKLISSTQTEIFSYLTRSDSYNTFCPFIRLNRDLIIVPSLWTDLRNLHEGQNIKWKVLNSTGVVFETTDIYTYITFDESKTKLYGIKSLGIGSTMHERVALHEISLSNGNMIKNLDINKFAPNGFLLSAITPNLDECILEKFDSISTYHINHWFNGFTKLKIKQ